MVSSSGAAATGTVSVPGVGDTEEEEEVDDDEEEKEEEVVIVAAVVNKDEEDDDNADEGIGAADNAGASMDT